MTEIRKHNFLVLHNMATSAGLPDLSSLYTNIDTYVKANIGIFAITLCICATIFYMAGGIKKEWSSKAIKLGTAAISGLVIFIFLPEIFGGLTAIASFFGGTNTVTIPGNGS